MQKIMCPKGCGEYLEQSDTDSRQEWTSCLLTCPNCGSEYEYYERYAIQSSRIVEQTLTDSNGNEIDF